MKRSQIPMHLRNNLGNKLSKQLWYIGSKNIFTNKVTRTFWESREKLNCLYYILQIYENN